MAFTPSPRTRRAVGGVLAAATVASAAPAAVGAPAPSRAAPRAVASGLPPRSPAVSAVLSRLEETATQVAALASRGQPARARAEARRLRRMAHGLGSTALRRGGVSRPELLALRVRADRVARLAGTRAPRRELAEATRSVIDLASALRARSRIAETTA